MSTKDPMVELFCMVESSFDVEDVVLTAVDVIWIDDIGFRRRGVSTEIKAEL